MHMSISEESLSLVIEYYSHDWKAHGRMGKYCFSFLVSDSSELTQPRNTPIFPSTAIKEKAKWYLSRTSLGGNVVGQEHVVRRRLERGSAGRTVNIARRSRRQLEWRAVAHSRRIASRFLTRPERSNSRNERQHSDIISKQRQKNNLEIIESFFQICDWDIWIEPS